MVLLYVVTEPGGQPFRAWLDAHRALLQRVRRWTIRLAVPATWTDRQHGHRALIEDFVGAPVRPAVVEEFRWFCQARLARERGGDGGGRTADEARYATARRAFGALRFYAAYRRWCAQGEPALHELLSPRLHEAWTRGDGQVEVQVLPHQYHHLVPAAATA